MLYAIENISCPVLSISLDRSLYVSPSSRSAGTRGRERAARQGGRRRQQHTVARVGGGAMARSGCKEAALCASLRTESRAKLKQPTPDLSSPSASRSRAYNGRAQVDLPSEHEPAPASHETTARRRRWLNRVGFDEKPDIDGLINAIVHALNEQTTTGFHGGCNSSELAPRVGGLLATRCGGRHGSPYRWLHHCLSPKQEERLVT